MLSKGPEQLRWMTAGEGGAVGVPLCPPPGHSQLLHLGPARSSYPCRASATLFTHTVSAPPTHQPGNISLSPGYVKHVFILENLVSEAARPSG